MAEIDVEKIKGLLTQIEQRELDLKQSDSQLMRLRSENTSLRNGLDGMRRELTVLLNPVLDHDAVKNPRPKVRVESTQ